MSALPCPALDPYAGEADCSEAAAPFVYRGRLNVRTAATAMWDTVQLGRWLLENHYHSGSDASTTINRKGKWTYLTLAAFMRYAVDVPGTRRKTPMNIEKMVAAWVPIIKGLSTAHTKEHLDRCEFVAETHLAPLLTAPVKQIREFYAALVAALKADPAVPLFVWTAFEAWHEVVVKKAPDKGIVELKTKLAAEVADLVEKDIAPDLRDALVGALQWRSPEALRQIKQAVQAGGKPRLKGRESCLFLCVPTPAGEAAVML